MTIPHPIDILIGKLGRLDAKDVLAFRRVIEVTGHPTKEEFLRELQNAVDLFRPAFEDESPNQVSGPYSAGYQPARDLTGGLEVQWCNQG